MSIISVKPMRGESVKNVREAGKALRFGFNASSKIDGMRALVTPDMPQTKQGYAIQNAHVRAMLAEPDLVGLDGELTAGDLFDQELCGKTVSAVMSEAGQPDFCYWLFEDFSNPQILTRERHKRLFDRFLRLAPRYPFLRYLPQREVHNEEELEQAIVDLTITEGIMLARLDAPYKHGKSTVNSQELLKYKPFADEEAVILDVIPGTTNRNAQTRNPLGGAKRSSAASGLVETDLAGSLLCENRRWGRFNPSLINLTHDERRWMLASKHQFIGKVCTFKYLPVGSIDKPRSPTFKCLKDMRT